MSTNVTLAGNLTDDPRPGDGQCTFTVATAKSTKDVDGSWREDFVTYWDVRCVAGLAVQVVACAGKGDRVIVVGRVDGSPVTVTASEVAMSLKFARVKVERLARKRPA